GPRLYGFIARDERRAFTALQSVQGVGPKAALGVLDVLSAAELAQAVAREDKAAVGRAQGVGSKLAQRIVVGLKDKPLVEVGGFAPRGRETPTPPGPRARAPGGDPGGREGDRQVSGIVSGEPQPAEVYDRAL